MTDLEERIAKIKEEVLECETENATLQRGIEKLKHESLKKDSSINELLRKGNDLTGGDPICKSCQSAIGLCIMFAN